MIMIHANALFHAHHWKASRCLNSHYILITIIVIFNVLQQKMTVTMISLNKHQLSAAQQILWYYMITLQCINLKLYNV